MKRLFLSIIILAALGAGVWLAAGRSGGEPDDKKPADKKVADAKPADGKADDKAGAEPAGIHVSRDPDGNVLLKVTAKAKETMGLKVAHPTALQMKPESIGHGQVVDPAPLVGLLTDVATAESAAAVSSNELVRLKTLSGQGNASARALQSAESAAVRDQLAAQAAQARLDLAWHTVLEKQNDVTAFARSLASLGEVLVRLDLPGGQTMRSAPVGARIVGLSGNSTDAQYLGTAPNVDPQTQGQGFMFLVKDNSAQFLPGAALTGYIQGAGDPVAGVLIPQEAIVRSEGSGWIYLQRNNAEDFVRFKIPLDHPADGGWFITEGVTPADSVVVTGAQSLLSEESKGLLQSD